MAAQGAGCGGSAGRLPRALLPGDAVRTRGGGRLSQNPALRPEQEDIYEGFGVPAYWIVEPSSDRPELTVFDLRSGTYEQTAHVIGGEGYRAAVPFPVTIVPSQLVTAK
jgi:hypothetical protein